MDDCCCFYCKFFKHLDPDTDYCERQDCEVYFDTPACGLFQYYQEDDDV